MYRHIINTVSVNESIKSALQPAIQRTSVNTISPTIESLTPALLATISPTNPSLSATIETMSVPTMTPTVEAMSEPYEIDSNSILIVAIVVSFLCLVAKFGVIVIYFVGKRRPRKGSLTQEKRMKQSIEAISPKAEIVASKPSEKSQRVSIPEGDHGIKIEKSLDEEIIIEGEGEKTVTGTGIVEIADDEFIIDTEGK